MKKILQQNVIDSCIYKLDSSTINTNVCQTHVPSHPQLVQESPDYNAKMVSHFGV